MDISEVRRELERAGDTLYNITRAINKAADEETLDFGYDADVLSKHVVEAMNNIQVITTKLKESS